MNKATVCSWQLSRKLTHSTLKRSAVDVDLDIVGSTSRTIAVITTQRAPGFQPQITEKRERYGRTPRYCAHWYVYRLSHGSHHSDRCTTQNKTHSRRGSTERPPRNVSTIRHYGSCYACLCSCASLAKQPTLSIRTFCKERLCSSCQHDYSI